MSPAQTSLFFEIVPSNSGAEMTIFRARLEMPIHFGFGFSAFG
jgi:hypothetical protein